MELTNFDKLITEIQHAGQDWVEAKLKSDQLEADEKNFLALMMNDLEKTFDEKVSDSKLERLVRGSKEFREYVTGRVAAQAETGRKKVRYENLQNFYEAKRSQLAFEREKLAKGIFHRGG